MLHSHPFKLISFEIGYPLVQVVLALVRRERDPHCVDLAHHETADPALLPVHVQFQGYSVYIQEITQNLQKNV